MAGEVKFEAGVVLFIVRDVTNYLEQAGLIAVDGKFSTPTIEQDVEIVKVVEKSLKEHGVAVPDQVDIVLSILPTILKVLGVK